MPIWRYQVRSSEGMVPTLRAFLNLMIEAPETVDLLPFTLFDSGQYQGPITDAPDGEYRITGPSAIIPKWRAVVIKRGDELRIR